MPRDAALSTPAGYERVVIGIALVTFLAWYFAGGVAFHQTMLFAVAVPVIACPVRYATAAWQNQHKTRA
jgi:cation transport ATPase